MAPAAPTLPATRTSICSTGLYVPILLSHHQRRGNRRRHNLAEASPQYAFVAAFDPTGAQLLYSTLFGDLNFKCTIGCGGDTYGTGVAVDANGYFYLVGETKASKLPTTAGVIQPTGAPLGNPANLCAGLARLHREVQSGHFRRWGIAGLRHLPWRENRELQATTSAASPSIAPAMPMSSDIPILRIFP